VHRPPRRRELRHSAKGLAGDDGGEAVRRGLFADERDRKALSRRSNRERAARRARAENAQIGARGLTRVHASALLSIAFETDGESDLIIKVYAAGHARFFSNIHDNAYDLVISNACHRRFNMEVRAFGGN
jgi:hypothetical protein